MLRLMVSLFICSVLLIHADHSVARGKIVGAQNYEHPDWFKESFLEISEDIDEANAEGKHVLLYFHLDACPYCHKMVEDNFKRSPHLDFLQANFDIIAINIRGDREVIFDEQISLTEKALARHLNVRMTPTLIFLSAENKPVLRVNGYRSVRAFKQVLGFVASKAYQHTTLVRFIEQAASDTVYTLREHASFTKLSDLRQTAAKPLFVLFEDHTCDSCDELHDEILSLEQTKTLLEHFTVVRLDALSEQAIIEPDGKKSTPKAFAERLAISYRPGIVLFDQGQEIERIDGLLYRYHLQEVLRYVGQRHYLNYSSLRAYMREREQALLDSGQDIDIGR